MSRVLTFLKRAHVEGMPWAGASRKQLDCGRRVGKEYKVTGDVVNLASRIEQLNKEFNTQLLISETVWQAVRGQGTHAASLGKVPIRGREEAVEIFALAT